MPKWPSTPCQFIGNTCGVQAKKPQVTISIQNGGGKIQSSPPTPTPAKNHQTAEVSLRFNTQRDKSASTPWPEPPISLANKRTVITAQVTCPGEMAGRCSVFTGILSWLIHMSGKITEPTPSSFWQVCRATIQGVDEPRQLATGLCLGLAIGLIPKFSVLPALFLVVLILSRANLLTGLIGITVGVLTLGGMQGNFDHWGYWFLTLEQMQSAFAWLQQLPLVPWLRFNNSLVAGSLLTLGIGWLPLMILSRLFFAWYHPHIVARWRDFMSPEPKVA